MSTPQHILHSRDVSTPVGSVTLSLPRCSPCGPQSPIKETAAVCFAHDNKHEDDVVAAAAKEMGEGANKKKRPAACIPSFRTSRSSPNQEEELQERQQ